MAAKLFAPFKKLPQQLPMFKKSSDKFKEVSLYNYNAVYGLPDDVVCQHFDNQLHLLAVGTKKGEIKIFGSPAVSYTLVSASLKPINFLCFIEGQGRLISINADNEMILWEFKIEESIWGAASHFCFKTDNGNVTSVDVGQMLPWKSDKDDTLELVLVGFDNNVVQTLLLIGSTFHIYDGDDVKIDNNLVFESIVDLDRNYDFGGVQSVQFRPDDISQFLILFKNGLLLTLNADIKDSKIVNGVEKKSSVEEIVTTEAEEKPTEPEVKAETTEPAAETKETDGEAKPAASTEEKPETEAKPATDASNGIKEEPKAVKESTQVPFAVVNKPNVTHYVLLDKKVNGVCWRDESVLLSLLESHEILIYSTNGTDLKISDPAETIALSDNDCVQISHIQPFSLHGNCHLACVRSDKNSNELLTIVLPNRNVVNYKTPSNIVDLTIVKSHKTDDEGSTQQPLLLFVLCKTQLIVVDLRNDGFPEVQCPYLSLRIDRRVTATTSVVQVQKALFPDIRSFEDLFTSWPLSTPVKSKSDADDSAFIDIIATGHSDGSLHLWHVMQSGIMYQLAAFKSTDVFVEQASEDATATNGSSIHELGHKLSDDTDKLLQISTVQLISPSTDGSSNQLYLLAGNASGSVMLFKFEIDCKETLSILNAEIKDLTDKQIIWNDTEAPALLDQEHIAAHLPNLNHIVRLTPSLPITSIAYQPMWELLAIGCTYGFALVDLKAGLCVYSYTTLSRLSKSAGGAVQQPLSVGQQLKKSVRQSFRKLKKLKPASKHTYTVNEEKGKAKEEPKATEEIKSGEESKPTEETKPADETKSPETEAQTQEEATQDGAAKTEPAENNQENAAEEAKEQVVEVDTVKPAEGGEEAQEAELVSVEISRKEKPSGSVGSLLLVNTNLKTVTRAPCLFVGTNIGAIYAFEVLFDDNAKVTVNLSKELHLLHKAPVVSLAVIDANHCPLISSNDQIGSFLRKAKVHEEPVEDAVEHHEDETNAQSKPAEEKEKESATDPEAALASDSEVKDDSKAKSGTLPAAATTTSQEEIPVTEVSRRSVDSGKDKVAPTNLKKSGTLPASFLQAIGKSSSPNDTHELLVVSEEQVKLFSLPSLKAKYKYKVVDTGHHFSHMKSEDKKSENASADAQNAEAAATTASVKKSSRRICAVGLCKSSSPKISSWGVTIALTNGELIGLTMNNVKKFLANLYNSSSSHIIAAITNGELNLVVSYTQGWNVQVTDFSQNPTHHFEPLATIDVPAWSRPVVVVVEEPVEKKPEEVPIETKEEKVEELTNGDVHAENELDEEKDKMGEEAQVQQSTTAHHGDITMDSIKEYITNMDGNVTVKTYESSTEKHITVKDGQMVTTIHEKQIDDGEIVKDDVVKITSDTIAASNEVAVNQ